MLRGHATLSKRVVYAGERAFYLIFVQEFLEAVLAILVQSLRCVCGGRQHAHELVCAFSVCNYLEGCSIARLLAPLL